MRPLLLCLLGVCLALLAGTFWLRLQAADVAVLESAPTWTEPAPRPAAAGSRPFVPATARESVSATELPAAPPGPRVFPADRRPARLGGRVVDANHDPMPGATVSVRSSFGETPPWADLDDDRSIAVAVASDGQGRFVFEHLPVGPYLVGARVTDGRCATVRHGVTEHGPELLLQLRAERSKVTIQVVDAQSRPVADATVTFFLAAPELTQVAGESPALVRSDALGLAGLWLDGRREGVAVVLDHHGACGAIPFGLRTTAARLVLGPAGRLAGTLGGASTEDLAGAEIAAHRVQGSQSAGNLHFARTVGRIDGTRYEFAALPPGDYALVLRAPRGFAMQHERITAPVNGTTLAGLFAEVRAGAVTTLDLQLVRGGYLAGCVRDDQGRPIVDAQVDLWRRGLGYDPYSWQRHGAPMHRFDAEPWTCQRDPQQQHQVRTGPDGRYLCAGLAPGEYAVTLSAPGWTTVARAAVAVVGGATSQADARLEAAAVLQGCFDPGDHVGLFRPGQETAALAFVAPAHGVCTLPGLAAGTWRVHSLGRSFQRLAEVVLVAGRTTWLDVRDQGPVTIRGHVVAAGAAVAGAQVAMPWRTATTDADGALLMRWPTPLPAGTGWCFRVTKGGGEWQVPFPAGLENAEAWSGELLLGEGELSLQTLDAEGQRAPADLELRGPTEAATQQRHFAGALHAHDGTAQLRGLPPGRYVASARFADGAAVRQLVDVPGRAPVALRAPRTGSLRVRLLDVRGQPLPGQIVGVLGGVADLAFGQWTATTDAHGEATLPGLPVQALKVGVFHWMFSGGEEERDPEPVPVTIRPTQTVAVVLQMRQ